MHKHQKNVKLLSQKKKRQNKSEVVLDYIDQTNTIEISNTDTAFSVDGERVTNQEFLNNGYANGNFKNQ